MKRKMNGTRLLVIATFLFVLQSVAGVAQSNINVSLYKPDTEIATIRIDDLKVDEPLSLSLKNEYGTTLFYDETKGASYLKMINFANVRDGKYLLDISQERGMVRRVIVKDAQGLSIKDESYVFHNFIKFNEDKKLLVKFNNGLNEPVTIRITDHEGRILHEEINIKAEDYATLFNLSRLHSGSYNMSVTSGNFSKNRKIQL